MKMTFKTFYFTLWMFFISLTVVKASCLEYGHSCWGAHGKRSGSNKIIHTDDRIPMQFEYTDINGLREKNTFDSAEEELNGSTDTVSSINDLNKSMDDDDLMQHPDKNSLKFKKFLYKKLNKTSKRQRNLAPPEHRMTKSNNMAAISDRWRRLPLYNLKRVQITSPENEWLDELEQEQQINEDDYI